MAKKTQPTPPPAENTGGVASFVDDRAVAGLLAGNEKPMPPKAGGRYKVNGVWVNANGERLEDQDDEQSDASPA